MSTLQERMSLAIKNFEKSTGKRFKNTDLARFAEVTRANVGLWINGPTKELEGSKLLRVSEFTEYSLRNILMNSANLLDEMLKADDVVQNLENSFTFYLPKASQDLANLQHILNRGKNSFQILYSEAKPMSFVANFKH